VVVVLVSDVLVWGKWWNYKSLQKGQLLFRVCFSGAVKKGPGQWLPLEILSGSQVEFVFWVNGVAPVSGNMK